jgi:Flp pilus assembly pilin Flp
VSAHRQWLAPTQRGQAAVEYTVVLGLTTLVLIVAAVDPSVIDQLLDAIKKFFKAFAWAISVAPQQGI